MGREDFRGLHRVFPAYAGVSRTDDMASPTIHGLPRLRGGEPAVPQRPAQVSLVFPAYAGVSLRRYLDPHDPRSLPRLRGGEPRVAEEPAREQ